MISLLPSTLERCRQALKHHSILAFPFARIPGYIEYNRAALSPVSAQTVQRLQYSIPAREPFVAWINQTYHFDFSRNPILDVEPAGLATNWARLPPSVRYVIMAISRIRSTRLCCWGSLPSGWLGDFVVRALNLVRSP